MENRILLSREYPLTIDFVASEYTDFYIPLILKRFKSRIRSLKLTGEGDIIQKKVSERMDKFPIVENLHIAVDSHTGITNVPDALFQNAPHLRDVHLRGVKFDLNLFSNLTHINLSDGQSAIIPSSVPSFSEILSMLDRCPLLQSLRLDGYLNFPSLSAIAIRPKVQLIHLYDLELVGLVENVFALMTSLELSSATSINLIPRGISFGEDISPLLVIIHRHLHRKEAPILRSISIQGSIGSYISITADVSPWIVPYSREHNHFSIVTHPRTQKCARQIISKILDALPVARITNLAATALIRSNDLTASTWRTIFGRLPAVTTIKMGVNQGMLTMLNGFLNLMMKGPSGLTGKRRRRSTRCALEPPSHLSSLILIAEMSGTLGLLDDAGQALLYESLSHMLLEYKEMNKPYKPAHVPFHMVSIERATHGYTRIYEQSEKKRLFELVEVLNIEGKQYDPVEEAKRRADWRKRAEERRILREFEQSDTDDDA